MPLSDQLREGVAVTSDPIQDACDCLAAQYDALTHRDDYDHRAGLYRQLIEQHKAPGRDLVDLGCGTGKGAPRLAAAGFAVTGIDLSPEMVRVAATKPGAESVRFLASDLRDLPEAGLVQVAEYEISLARPRPDSDEGRMRPGGDADGDRTRLVVVRKSSVTR